MTGIKKGDLVEFTDAHHQHYTIGDPKLARYGVSTENANGFHGAPHPVELADGTIIKVRYIHATGWSGWVPDGLDEACIKYNPDPDEYLADRDADYPY